MLQLEIKQIKAQIERDKEYQRFCVNQYDQKALQIQQIKNTLPKGDKYLSQDSLRKLDGQQEHEIDMEAMSEFSVLTEESDIGPGENILDLRVAQVEFDRRVIDKIFNLKETMPQAVRTFVTFDFFVNETKNTDLKDGYSPQFDTIFCFKNKVDDFYIKHMLEQSIRAEVYAVKGSSKKTTIKIGEAHLPLSTLISGEASFQVQEILFKSEDINQNDRQITLGKISYRMRMRKPLDSALKFYRETISLDDKTKFDPKNIDALMKTKEFKSLDKKIFEITVKRATNLKKPD